MLALKQCLDGSSGVTGGITGHMEEERRVATGGGVGERQTVGLMDNWIYVRPKYTGEVASLG